MSIESEIERRLQQMQRDSEIHCPFCDALYEDEDNRHITYHGDGPAKAAECETCEREFFVEETVVRTYETRPGR